MKHISIKDFNPFRRSVSLPQAAVSMIAKQACPPPPLAPHNTPTQPFTFDQISSQLQRNHSSSTDMSNKDDGSVKDQFSDHGLSCVFDFTKAHVTETDCFENDFNPPAQADVFDSLTCDIDRISDTNLRTYPQTIDNPSDQLSSDANKFFASCLQKLTNPIDTECATKPGNMLIRNNTKSTEFLTGEKGPSKAAPCEFFPSTPPKHESEDLKSFDPLATDSGAVGGGFFFGTPPTPFQKTFSEKPNSTDCFDEFESIARRQDNKSGSSSSKNKSTPSFEIFSFDDEELKQQESSCLPHLLESLNIDKIEDQDSLMNASESSEDEIDDDFISGVPLIPIGSPSNRTFAAAERLDISTDSLYRTAPVSPKIQKAKERRTLMKNSQLKNSYEEKMFPSRESTSLSLSEAGERSIHSKPQFGTNRLYKRSSSNTEILSEVPSFPMPILCSEGSKYASTPSNIGSPASSPKSLEDNLRHRRSPNQSISVGSLPKSLVKQQSLPPLELAQLGPVGFFDNVPSLTHLLKSNFLRKVKNTNSFDKLYDTSTQHRRSYSTYSDHVATQLSPERDASVDNTSESAVSLMRSNSLPMGLAKEN